MSYNEELQDILNGTAKTSSKYFIIDENTRQITPPSDFVTLGVVSDADSERVWFECPRYVGDNVDLTKRNLYINYQNANGEKDRYYIDDVTIDGENVHFSWELRRKALTYKGDVKFIFCAIKPNSAEEKGPEWNTTLCTAPVLEGLEVENPLPDTPEYDIINQLIELTRQLNILRGRKSGVDNVVIDDVSPTRHILDVKVSSKNLLDLSKAINDTYNCIKNEDGTVTCNIVDSNWSSIFLMSGEVRDAVFANKGKTVTFSIAETLEDKYMEVVIWDRKGGKEEYCAAIKRDTNSVSVVIDEALESVSAVELRFNCKPNHEVHTDTETVISEIQLEFGDTATPYTPYVDIEDTSIKVYGADETVSNQYTPTEDGIIEGIESIYPSMTFESDVTGVLIECEYNRDINHVVKTHENNDKQTKENLSVLHENKLRDVYRAKALGGDVDDDVALQRYIDDETYIYIPAGKYTLNKPLKIRKFGTVIQGEGYGFKTALRPYDDNVTALLDVRNESGNSMMFTIRDICFRTVNVKDGTNSNCTCIASTSYIIDSKIENCWFNGGATTVALGTRRTEDGIEKYYYEDTSKPRISSTAISLNAIHTIISGCWFECFETAIHLGQSFDAKKNNRNSNGYMITNCDFWANLNAIEASGRGVIRGCHFASMLGGFAVRGFNDCLVHVSDCSAWFRRYKDILSNLENSTLLFKEDGVGKVIIAEDTSHLIVRDFSVNDMIPDGSAYSTIFNAKDTSHLVVNGCDMYEGGNGGDGLRVLEDSKKIESESSNFRFELDFDSTPDDVVCATGSKIYYTNPNQYIGAVYTSNGWKNFGGEYDNIEALESDLSCMKQQTSNVLKGSATGEIVVIKDISPNEHTLDVKLSSKNLVDVSKWTCRSCSYADGIITCNMNNVQYAEIYTTKLNDILLANKGKNITFSIAETLENRYISMVIQGKKADGTNLTIAPYNKGTNNISAVISVEFASISMVTLRFNWQSGTNFTDTTTTISDIQLEFGALTFYTPYIEDFSYTILKRYGVDETDNLQDYVCNSDGTVEDVKSIYPSVTLVSDKEGVTIECNYNKDVNRVIENLTNAIISLGGSV